MDLIHKILYFLTLKHHHCGNIAAYASRFLVSGLLFSVSKTTAFTTLKLRTQMLPSTQIFRGTASENFCFSTHEATKGLLQSAA